MQAGAEQNPTDPFAANVGLRELLDSSSLESVLSSFYALFQIPIRILDTDGRALAKNRKQPALSEFWSELPGGAARLGALYETLKRREPDEDGQFSLTSFTGATYHVAAIAHDGRRIGRVVFGPFLMPGADELAPELPEAAPQLDARRARELLAALPRVREETIRAISRHLGVTLDALIFAGHKAWLTEAMHLCAVQESFRELGDKAELLEQAERSSIELSRSRLRLFAGVANDIGTRLSDVLTRLESRPVEPRALGGSPERSTLERDMRRLRGIARSLSDLARLEQGDFPIHKAELDPAQLLSEVRFELEQVAGAASVELGLPLVGAPLRWLADRAVLRQVLTLLGQSALDTREPGALRLEARLGSEAPAADGGWVLLGAPRSLLELEVSAPGRLAVEPGRAAAPLDADAALALALVERLLDAHGGQLRVEDRPPHGSAFVVALPLEEPGVS
jgi:two-component system sensor histidine kinase BarA